MIQNSKDKMMNAAQVQEYHFSGSTVYQPISIKAASREEAEAEWLKQRVAVASDTPTPKTTPNQDTIPE